MMSMKFFSFSVTASVCTHGSSWKAWNLL